MYDRGDTGTKAAGLVAATAVATSLFVGIRAKRHQSRRDKLTRLANKRANAVLQDQRVQSIAQSARESLEAAMDRAGDIDTDALRDQLTRRLADVSRTAREEVQPRAGVAARRARSVSAQLGSQGVARSKELRDRVQTDVAPSARSWAQQALEQAQSAFDEARERAVPAVTETKEHYVPVISNKAAAAGGFVAGAISTGAHWLSRRMNEMELPSAPSKSLPSKVAGQSADVAKRTAGQVTHATRETAMIICWSGALGAVVYYGLMSPERRKQASEAVSRAYHQVRDLISDFQGDEDDRPPVTI
ncbi:MAG TPA: hypothetical protein VKU87_06295 [Thermomicrobiaceae bacterium]|nr:hypothetical protein [Thermomicrobiaceae bacterium]